MPAPDRPVTETPARSGCTCPPRAGFGQERVHDTSNARCELVRARAVNPVDELGQIRLLLQSAGLGGHAPAAGVRALIAQRDQYRDALHRIATDWTAPGPFVQLAREVLGDA